MGTCSRKREGYPLTIFSLIGILLLISTVSVSAQATEGETGTKKPIELFGTMEFRGSLKALQKWTQVVTKARQQVKTYTDCTDKSDRCSSAARSWHQMEKTALTLTSTEQLKWVNQFFNRWPYRLDLETYGLRDYWATPKEFMQFSGDCEDYSISKYFALRALGLPAEKLRIVVIKDNIRNLGHAVLAVYQGDQVYILDNLSDLVLPHYRYQHYQPQYSVNENYRWAHIRKLNRLSNTQATTKGP